MDWYYAIDSRKIGPVRQEDIQRLADEREIGPETLVWHEGLDQWKPLRDIGYPIDLETDLPELDEDQELDEVIPLDSDRRPAGLSALGPLYLLRRLAGWFIDAMIYTIVGGTLSIFLYARIHDDGEQFMKDYMELQQPSMTRQAPAEDSEEESSNPSGEEANAENSEDAAASAPQGDGENSSDSSVEADSPAPPAPNLGQTFMDTLKRTREFNEKYPKFQYLQQGFVFALWIITDTLMVVYLGGSLGKLVTGIRVYDREGNPPGFYSALGKSIIRAIETTLPPILLISGVVVLYNRERRSISDRLNSTLVRPQKWKFPSDRMNDINPRA
jgi:hypothetical protein